MAFKNLERRTILTWEEAFERLAQAQKEGQHVEFHMNQRWDPSEGRFVHSGCFRIEDGPWYEMSDK